jgi:hypothetical protein
MAQNGGSAATRGAHRPEPPARASGTGTGAGPGRSHDRGL